MPAWPKRPSQRTKWQRPPVKRTMFNDKSKSLQRLGVFSAIEMAFTEPNRNDSNVAVACRRRETSEENGGNACYQHWHCHFCAMVLSALGTSVYQKKFTFTTWASQVPSPWCVRHDLIISGSCLTVFAAPPERRKYLQTINNFNNQVLHLSGIGKIHSDHWHVSLTERNMSNQNPSHRSFLSQAWSCKM